MNKPYPKLTVALCLSLAAAVGLACNNSADQAPAADSASIPTTSGTANSPATPPASTSEISGNYTIAGTNEGGGGNYGGTLAVTKRDDVYQFSWASGEKKYDGVGVRTDDTVAVAFTEGSDGKGCGVVLYKIAADGSLNGKAGYWGVNEAEAERAKRTSGSDLVGAYDVSGTNAGGGEYKGKLEVKKDGVGYTFAWNAGSTLSGFGIRTGDKAAVGFGGPQCGFVSYEIKPDGTLEGKWGGQGSKSVGTESAKKS